MIIGQRGRCASPLLRATLHVADGFDAVVERCRHRLVHAFGVRAFDETGRPAVAPEQLLEFLMADSRQQRRVVDLVAVEVEDRQHGTVADRVEELADVPGSGQWPGLGLAVTDHGSDNQIGLSSKAAPQACDST
jgi:hypothetical protein